MASTSFFFATSFLLLSFAAMASAADYSYTPKSQDAVKPENAKPEYGHIPKAPETEHFKPKSEHLPKPEVPKPEYVHVPKPEAPKYDNVPKEKLLETAIEGLVLCRKGSKYIPLKGAVARIVCSGVDENGYETTPFSCLTGETDAKGYFLKTFSSDKLKLKECKAYLESSAMETCSVPTDVNKGITGALLSSYRILNWKLKLYHVGPFFFTPHPESTPIPTGY